MTVSNALDSMFAAARQSGRGVLIPYLTAGYPEPESFVDLAVAVLEAGASALEIGIPFSDPLLDGPSTQRSQQQALAAGITPVDCLQYAADIHGRSSKPLLFMGAYNPILAYGPDRFCAEAASAGISAIIIPDVPFEEQVELRDAAAARSLHLIQLVAPTSSAERLRRVCAIASGFIYGVSVSGVTGARAGVTATARPLVEAVRRYSDLPIAVGFGIAERQHVRDILTFADGAIVGSALINCLADALPGQHIKAAEKFIRELSDALEPSEVT